MKDSYEYVSYEVAKLAAEKGFVPSFDTIRGIKYYNHEGVLGGDATLEVKEIHDSKKQGVENLGKFKSVYAPKQSELQKWLRDVHNIYIEILTDCTTEPKFCYNIKKFVGDANDLSKKEWYWEQPVKESFLWLYRDYEEALECALSKSLYLITITNHATITIKIDDSCDMAVVSDNFGYVYCGNFWDFHDGCHKADPEIKNFNSYTQLAERLVEKHIKNGYSVNIVKEKFEYLKTK